MPFELSEIKKFVESNGEEDELDNEYPKTLYSDIGLKEEENFEKAIKFQNSFFENSFTESLVDEKKINDFNQNFLTPDIKILKPFNNQKHISVEISKIKSFENIFLEKRRNSRKEYYENNEIQNKRSILLRNRKKHTKNFSNFLQKENSVISIFLEKNEEIFESNLKDLMESEMKLKNIILNLSKNNQKLLKQNKYLKKEIRDLNFFPKKNLFFCEENKNFHSEIIQVSLNNFLNQNNIEKVFKTMPFIYIKYNYLKNISNNLLGIKKKIFINKEQTLDLYSLIKIYKNCSNLHKILNFHLKFIKKNILNKSLDKMNSNYIKSFSIYNFFSLKFINFTVNSHGFTEYSVNINDKLLQKKWEFKTRYSIF